MPNDRRKIFRRQRGAALPTVLVILFVLTVLGMLSLSTAGVEVRLAANERDYQRALYAAEGGVAHMRGILQEKLIPPSALPDWTFDLSGFWVGTPTTGGINNVLAGYQYHVYVYDNDDGGGAATDVDGLVMVRADATGPAGTRASVEMMMSAAGTADSLSGYSGQAGAGQGKSFSGNDTSAITDTTVNNLGGL